MRVLVAMSGGVDSSVAAARMVDAGHEVVGVHLALSRAAVAAGQPSRGCCTLDDARDARRVADLLGIPFYVWDMAEAFEREVIENFLAEYQAGHTPNPCLRCNERIKFSAVLDRARALGFDAVATGHYAQVLEGPHGPELHRAVDPTKDQSYVLAVITAEQLRHSLFPLGADTKERVRAEAAERGLLVARKPDSTDICFIPDGDTAGFLRSRLGAAEGDIVDAHSGEVIGQHDGVYGFTIGQRRGLDLGNRRGDGARRYVVDVDIATRRVLVGEPELLDVDRIVGEDAIWAGPALAEQPTDVVAQMRAHGRPIPARAWVDRDTVQIELLEPIRGLATGQAAVLYEGTRVIGSTTVRATHRMVTA